MGARGGGTHGFRPHSQPLQDRARVDMGVEWIRVFKWKILTYEQRPEGSKVEGTPGEEHFRQERWSMGKGPVVGRGLAYLCGCREECVKSQDNKRC